MLCRVWRSGWAMMHDDAGDNLLSKSPPLERKKMSNNKITGSFTKKIAIDLDSVPDSTVQSGIVRLIESGEYPISADRPGSGLRLTLRQQSGIGFDIEPTSAGATSISFAEPADAFRAVAHLIGALHAGEAAAPHSEHTQFRFRCVQIDASRNGVPTVETI